MKGKREPAGAAPVLPEKDGAYFALGEVSTMATKTYQTEKLKVKPQWKVLPCKDRECTVSTNKRYRSPAGIVYVACMFEHAETACRLDLARQQKALALAAA